MKDSLMLIFLQYIFLDATSDFIKQMMMMEMMQKAISTKKNKQEDERKVQEWWEELLRKEWEQWEKDAEE